MYSFLTCFFLLITTACVYSKDPEDGELKLVSVIFRHGARTTYSFYPTDPYNGETFYPFGLGGLTNEGKMGEYKLGQYLRNQYDDFLGVDWTEQKVWVRSTDVTRTKMSAQLVLAGLFPPSEILKWNDNLLWIPVPISYNTDADEDLFHPVSNCPYKQQVLKDLPNIEEVQKIYIEPFQELYDYIQNNSGKTIKIPSDIGDFFFIVKCESDMGYILPDWTDSIYPDDIEQAASVVYNYHNYDSKVKQINSGYMLKKILDDSKKTIDGQQNDRKIYLYSGHESTVGYMLSALNVDQGHVPPYGSAIQFELRQKDDEFFIKLRYRNDTEGTEPIDLVIPGCEVLCPYDKFISLLDYLIPTESIQDACKLDS